MPAELSAGVPSRLTDYRLLGVAVVALALAFSWLTPLDLFSGGILALAAVGLAAVVLFPRARRSVVRRTGVGLGAWATAALLFAASVALTYALGSPQPFCERPRPTYRGCLTAYGLGAALFLASTAGAAVALGHARRYRRLSGTPVGGAGTADPGRRAVVGRVVPAGETRRTPAGAEAVWYRYEVLSEDGPSGDEDEPPSGPATDGGTEFAQFYVEDGSGRLLVVPQDVDEYLAAAYATTATTTVEAGDPMPGDAAVAADRTYRVREWRIEPDDVVFASGRVADASRAASPASTALGLDGEVALAAARQEQVVGDVRWRVLAGAAVLVLVGGSGYATMLLSM